MQPIDQPVAPTCDRAPIPVLLARQLAHKDGAVLDDQAELTRHLPDKTDG
jgi:hypothetical protein